MARRAALALFGSLASALAGCHRGGARPLTDGDRMRVYAAVLQEVQGESRDSSARLAVIDTLMPGDLMADQVDYVSSRLHVDRALVAALLDAQRAAAERFPRSILPDGRALVLSFGHLDSLRRVARAATAARTSPGTSSDLFWKNWRELYPESPGFVILSPASISPDGRDALVYVTRSCGSLCGTGEIRHLRRDARGQWRTAGTLELWVS
ncbi:MAG: hypothetical protein IT355_06465 [Gemmatimonadaceae bacterium]|nr:hypothetical protein [Gemmatimonadaceae bacterium]